MHKTLVYVGERRKGERKEDERREGREGERDREREKNFNLKLGHFFVRKSSP